MRCHLVFRSLSLLFCLVVLAGSDYAQEVRLQYKFKAGDVLRYRETTQNDMSSAMMPNGGQKVFNQMYTTQKIDKINADGSAEIRETIDSVITLLNGEPFNNPQTSMLVGIPITVTVATTGKILDARPANDSAEGTAKEAIEILRKQMMTQPGFPGTSIKMNETWYDSASISQATQMGSIKSDMKFSTQLTGTDRIAETDVKVLERTMTMEGEIGVGGGTLKGSGKGNIYFSDILGREIKSTMTMDQALDMVSPQGPVNMTMKISVTRELLD